MRLKVLSDNRILNRSLNNEHGLCIYLETEKYKCLLDTGASDKFVQNADLMEVDIADIDYVFISHGHADHIGGLYTFLQMNQKAKIILSENILTNQFFSTRKGMRNIGPKEDLSSFKDRFILVDSNTVIAEKIHVFPCTSCQFTMPKANKTLLKKTENELLTDDFNHELIICFGKNELVVYTGCAHCGFLNILDSVKNTIDKPITALIGGFHLLDDADNQFESEKEITEIANRILCDFPDTKFYTGHCTGDKAYSLIKSKLNNNLNWFYTGYVSNIKSN